MIKIYLAGTTSATKYRKYVKENFGKDFNLIDPIHEEYLEFEEKDLSKKEMIKLVNLDKSLILSSDILVAYIKDGPTFGTVMEIIFAHEHNKPVFIIDNTIKYFNDYWLVANSKAIYFTIDDCFKYINYNYNKSI